MFLTHTDDGLYVQLAKNSTHPKHKHVALIFVNGILVTFANNVSNNHAEIRALDRARLIFMGDYPDDLMLVSIAITKDGKLKLAKPCKRCEANIKRRGIKHVRYSTKAGRIISLY